MKDRMTGLRQRYLDAIREIDIEDLEAALPSSSYSNFYPLMKGIISELNDEIKIWKDTAKTCTTEIERRECEQESRKVEQKLSVCERVYRQQYTIEQEEDKEKNQVTQTTPYILIFGVNPIGNIPFKKDLERDIDIHYYEQLTALLESLEYGTNSGNIEKRRKLGSSSKNLRGIYEMKGFQIRIIYRELPNNMLYIEMVRVKKDDWSLKCCNEIETRDALLSKDYAQVRRRIKEQDKVEDLIISNQQILSEFKQYIEKNSIGRKKA